MIIYFTFKDCLTGLQYDLLNGHEDSKMPNVILSDTSASVSELKKNPMATVDAGDGLPVAILNRNKPAFYCVPAHLYEAMMESLDDLDLIEIVKEREGGETIEVDIGNYL